MRVVDGSKSSIISIHALLAESDGVAQGSVAGYKMNFYPRSPCGERPHQHLSSDFRRGYFYPRSPCGERRCYSLRHSAQGRYFYPRSPCGERPASWKLLAMHTLISIHALLAESDAVGVLSCYLDNIISIHALLAESDRGGALMLS